MKTSMQNLLKNYPVVWTETLQWGDMDMFNHINNVHYFRYFENARMAYLKKLDILGRLKSASLTIVVRDQGCRYKAPLKFPDTISVGISAVSIEPDRLTFKYDIISQHSELITATGTSTMVVINSSTGRKSNMPDDVAEEIGRLESL
jgi:acyl-CoA thioester hydrolase